MDNNDLDKLKLLSNSSKEYVAALLIKFRENAINNGHDMSVFSSDYYLISAPSYIHWAHCKKCLFDMSVEYFEKPDRIYYDLLNANKKCPAASTKLK